MLISFHFWSLTFHDLSAFSWLMIFSSSQICVFLFETFLFKLFSYSIHHLWFSQNQTIFHSLHLFSNDFCSKKLIILRRPCGCLILRSDLRRHRFDSMLKIKFLLLNGNSAVVEIWHVFFFFKYYKWRLSCKVTLFL